MDKLEELVAKQEIHENLLRYARGVDRRDWALVRDTYHDGAIDWHGEFHGDADAFIAWVSERHATVPFSMHLMANSLIEITGPVTACAETYFIAMSRREPPDGENTDIEVFGRYIDRFEKREDGVWRVAARKVVYDSTRTAPSTNHLRTLQGALGQRDGSDAVYELA
ncbi:MAG: nuclear transport factor 2 family protein [Rhodobacteraceae bacterium]|jgi:hypothetical protein|uniref:SnoaL-like domain-containing protein n=1 Tax=Salipiger profundus TaxID=1229727 RepID=A0A1U7DA85_9RHOB|nr:MULTISPECIES: nuclear transport factor 2 family protein [Salipiger]APX24986.1 SnoaL-like domain-containing protein [Salipiger profundus]MAB07899.1 nuclear transport factor 2 family protein [Paracoccaceae bacterium]GFZ99349.1 hypothetical protein GCM10011326_08430 [Salipiger profundus]SFC93162.1 SnoaL-like domain-containing protein [Salipiger profundus]